MSSERAGIELEEGELVVVTGPQGAGKSELIERLASQARQLWGWMGQAGARPGEAGHSDQRPLGRCCSVVHAESFFDPRKSVMENVRLPLQIAGLGGPRWNARLRQAMELLELPMDDRPIGPMPDLHPEFRQRVGWARALATDPQLLLIDDATHCLRPSIQDALIEALRERVARRASVVWATREMPAGLASVALRWVHMRAGVIEHDERFVTEFKQGHGAQLSQAERGVPGRVSASRLPGLSGAEQGVRSRASEPESSDLPISGRTGNPPEPSPDVDEFAASVDPEPIEASHPAVDETVEPEDTRYELSATDLQIDSSAHPEDEDFVAVEAPTLKSVPSLPQAAWVTPGSTAPATINTALGALIEQVDQDPRGTLGFVKDTPEEHGESLPVTLKSVAALHPGVITQGRDAPPFTLKSVPALPVQAVRERRDLPPATLKSYPARIEPERCEDGVSEAAPPPAALPWEDDDHEPPPTLRSVPTLSTLKPRNLSECEHAFEDEAPTLKSVPALPLTPAQAQDAKAQTPGSEED